MNLSNEFCWFWDNKGVKCSRSISFIFEKITKNRSLSSSTLEFEVLDKHHQVTNRERMLGKLFSLLFSEMLWFFQFWTYVNMAKFTNEVLYKILLTRIILEVILKYTKSSNAGILTYLCAHWNELAWFWVHKNF